MTERVLVLLRHAKADDPDRHSTDFERPLSARGRTDAVAAGRWLAECGLRPDHVLCSSAVRTRETWQGVASTIGEVPVSYEPSVYLAEAFDLLELIQRTADDVSTLLVIGHNPGMSAVSGLLEPDGPSGGGLSTAGIAVHRFTGAWSDVDTRSAVRTLSHTARG